MSHAKQSKQLAKKCALRCEGNWEALKYKVIDAIRMREFIRIITTYGNSMICCQEVVDDIENVLLTYKTFATYKAATPEIVQYSVQRGYAYLFATLTCTITQGSVNCPTKYVVHDLEKGTSTLTS